MASRQILERLTESFRITSTVASMRDGDTERHVKLLVAGDDDKVIATLHLLVPVKVHDHVQIDMGAAVVERGMVGLALRSIPRNLPQLCNAAKLVVHYEPGDYVVSATSTAKLVEQQCRSEIIVKNQNTALHDIVNSAMSCYFILSKRFVTRGISCCAATCSDSLYFLNELSKFDMA